jgi:CRISPR/Cas system-associated exonuclease Cas4 (RecB family)
MQKTLTGLLPWSYTKLSGYERCPAAVKYRYIDKLRTPQSSQASRGSDAHKSIEDYLTGAGRKLHDAVEPFSHVVSELKEKRCDVEFKIGITKGWKSTSFKEGYGRSVLDSAYVDGDTIHIQEWKTGKMYDDHTDQRHLYLAFASVNWPVMKKLKITSYYFDLGKKKTLELEKKDIADVIQDYNARVTIMVNDDVLAPRPGYYCAWCNYSKVKGGPCRLG